MLTLVHDYYKAWAARDRESVRAALASELTFRSPQRDYRFDTADAFLDCCWALGEGLAAVSFLKEISGEGEAVLILGWETRDGSRFVSVEYVRLAGGRLDEIRVLSNDPSCGEIVADWWTLAS